MTVTISKLHLAIAVLAIAMIAPATAFATHVFDDVPDDAFYRESVQWAAANGITVGRTPDLFDPGAAVTRGEAMTFLRRYDVNVVQPTLAALQAAQPFAVTARDETEAVTTADEVVVSVPVTAPVAGQVTVSSTTGATESNQQDTVRCSITTGTTVDSDYLQVWQSNGPTAANSQLAGTRVFAIAAGTTVTYNLVCDHSGFTVDTILDDSLLSAIFTPAP